MEVDADGRRPGHCLITYCLLSIIVSLWEMAIDPCVFARGPVSLCQATFHSHIHTFQDYKPNQRRQMCAVQRRQTNPVNSCKSGPHIQVTSCGLCLMQLWERGHVCAAALFPPTAFPEPVLSPECASVFHLTHRTQPRKGKRVRLQNRIIFFPSFSLLLVAFLFSPPSFIFGKSCFSPVHPTVCFHESPPLNV